MVFGQTFEIHKKTNFDRNHKYHIVLYFQKAKPSQIYLKKYFYGNNFLQICDVSTTPLMAIEYLAEL